MNGTEPYRRLPVGAECLPGGGVHFRVWAPRRRRVSVFLEGTAGQISTGPREVELSSEGDGYFSSTVHQAGDGSCYRYRLDGGADLFPDPASRYQPDGPHGPSQVVDPAGFDWTDEDWRGIGVAGQVIYEMHIGTFTQEGVWATAAEQLPDLANLGITVLEVMPVAEFPGLFGWGYDGVNLFAPTRLYGRPDDFRAFVDTAHAAGLGVILDVVYNHLGPDGNYLKQFSEDYFTDRYENEWGEPINFDGENSGPVREFFLANVAYWIREFHLDGLRLDATQQIFDASPEHILAAITRTARAAAEPRSVLLVGENEPQQMRLVRPLEAGGYGLDMLWSDDYHHSAMVALTGRNEAYYTDYMGSPQEFISAAKYGFLFQGQRYKWQKKRRGTPTYGADPRVFVTFTQNHDQIANSGAGHRVHMLTSPGRHRTILALTLLGPGTPMLFQGQEFAASSPFLYFADHQPELADRIQEGRAQFLGQFPSLALPEMQEYFADPADPDTFHRAKLDLAEREGHPQAYSLVRDLLRLRREDPVFSNPRPGGVDGAVLGDEAFVLRFFGEEGDDRLMLVNMDRDLQLDVVPEPLLAPPEGRVWRILWSSEDPRYGGLGSPLVETDAGWRIHGQAAVVMSPIAADEAPEEAAGA